MERCRNILKHYWGYDGFRPLQEEIIGSVLEGRDTLALMPTGGGKSITFQIPTLSIEGVCLVVTPLIALMKDQVDNLRKRKIKATAIYSGMSGEEIHTALNNCLYGNYKFLYVSPERLSSRLFLDYLQRIQFCLIAVDEAHCISQWGYDFRPAYLQIATIRPFLPGVPVLALTATATDQVVTDIQEKLKFAEPNVLRKSFIRKNLSYVVRETVEKNLELTHILNRVKGSAIVYVRNRARTREIAQMLTVAGIEADYYHAGLARKDKEARQTAWTQGNCRVIVSTNAFGMGIDKADVRCVVHYDAPDSLEEYFQEAGRAGRDEKKAFAVFLFNKHDNRVLSKRISDRFPPKEFIRDIYDKLGSYLRLAIHTGKERTFDFSLEKFCLTYRLPSLQVYHALGILTQAGYIDYVEEPDNKSRVMFLVRRDDLYRLHEQSPDTERVMQALLRNYTGLFADYAFIDEDFLAQALNLKRDQIYQHLIHLDKLKIIDYIPQSNSPLIFYPRQREEAHHVALPTSIYEQRQEKYRESIESVRRYLTDRNRCRSRQLIAYFGETEADDCGICDVCLARKQSTDMAEPRFLAIQQAILTALNEKPRSIELLIGALPYPKRDVLLVLEQLIESGSVTHSNSLYSTTRIE